MHRMQPIFCFESAPTIRGPYVKFTEAINKLHRTNRRLVTVLQQRKKRRKIDVRARMHTIQPIDRWTIIKTKPKNYCITFLFTQFRTFVGNSITKV